MNWETRFLDGVSQDVDAVDEFDDISGIADTCEGPPNDVLCRDYAEVGSYSRHSTSLFYRADAWTVGAGIRNVFDKRPPAVDGDEVLAVGNTPIGYGYDLQGRTFFVDVAYRFGAN